MSNRRDAPRGADAPASGQPDRDTGVNGAGAAPRQSGPAENPEQHPTHASPPQPPTHPSHTHAARHDDAAGLTAFASTRGRFYAYIFALMCCVFLISNISATKVIEIGPFVTDGGAFLFPLAYILGDVISEVYGFKAAKRAVLMGFAMQALAVLVFFVVQIAPPGPGYENQSAFEAVLGFYPRIALASLCGYLVGQLLNAYILVKVKRRMGEKHLWIRLLTSTGVGEFADTLIFCVVAFAGVIPGWDFVNYIIVGFLYKVAVEVLFMPVTYRVIQAVKKRESTYAPGGAE